MCLNSIRIACLTVVTAAFSLAAPHSQAAFIEGVTVHGVGSIWTADSSANQWIAQNTITGEGLTLDSNPATHTTDTGNSTQGYHWLTAENAPDADKWIAYDLNAVYTLTGLHLWNYNRIDRTNRGASEIDIYVSLDGSNWGTAISTISPTEATNSNGYLGETFSIGPVATQYIRLQIIDNHGDTFGGGFGLTGLSEVRFIPEPASLALLGLGGLVMLGRRGARPSEPS